MEMTDLSQAIWNTAKRIESGVDVVTAKGREYAKAESEYRRLLAIEIMRLKEEKVPVSIISDVARGNLHNELFKRDLAEMEYKSCREMLGALQSELTGLQSLLKVMNDI